MFIQASTMLNTVSTYFFFKLGRNVPVINLGNFPEALRRRTVVYYMWSLNLPPIRSFTAIKALELFEPSQYLRVLLA